MTSPGSMARVRVDASRTHQTIDGFGVNINSKYWNDGTLIPTMRLLHDDLGARLYRVDIFGKSNWIDEEGSIGPASLDPSHLERIYTGPVARSGWAMLRWLNEQGIEPYLTCSGDVPYWMLGDDGKTLVDYDSFCDMLVSLVEWAVKREGLKFTLFGPLNETDLGQPEGPKVSPEEFAQVIVLLDAKLSAKGLDQVKLVVAEQARFSADYLKPIVALPQLKDRIGVFGLHTYTDLTPGQFADVLAVAQSFPQARVWMTEFGDLDQSGEKEWYVAWRMASRLFDLLEAGFSGAMVWDAYDNYHDHDEAWTIYGLLRTGLRVYTPKKRYHAMKHIFRFAPLGWQRVEATSELPGLRVLAFTNAARDQVTLVGMNTSGEALYLNAWLDGFAESVAKGSVAYYRTSDGENCHRIGNVPVRGPNWPFNGIDAFVPPHSIFTLTKFQ
jgi:O-glycosyl hydrolase